MPMQAIHRHPHTGVDASAGVHHVMIALIAVVALCLLLIGILHRSAPPRHQKLDRVEAIANRRVRVWQMAGDELDKDVTLPQSGADSRTLDLAR